jgi:ketosteroid isomerase-like protein
MRRLLITGVLGVIALALAACSGSGVDQSLEDTLRAKADRYDIDQIEKSFHEATTEKDIDLMMTLWAPNATMTIGSGETVAGLEAIRRAWLTESVSFEPDTHLVSDHPAYKVDITVNGDRGTLHFECHYVNYDTRRVKLTTVADLDVARIDGRWLITNMVAASTTLAP